MNRAYLLIFALFVSAPVIAQTVIPRKTLTDAHGAAFEVSNVIDIGDRIPTKEFWRFIKPSRKLGKPVDPWSNPVTRSYFFGRYSTYAGAADPIPGSERLLTLPHAKGLLGKEVEAERPLVIADDIPFQPIMRRHGKYSSRYYPRRMHDWIVGSLQPAYLLTGKKEYLYRMKEMFSFLLYSQYQPDGSNQFTKDFYPEDYERLLANGNAKRWRGGWDYLFDWEWEDAYGYQWSLHEPDHHVGANIALAMLQGWQLTGDKRYFTAAEEFFYYQTADYGFHSGDWDGHKYYWTQYGRSGSAKSATGATDNIQALVARTAAMLGYYKKDPVLLEYARGLLWYQVREFVRDGRWYYDGAENPLNRRKVQSHEGVVLNDALSALAYLMKAGMPVEELLKPLGDAVHWYRENFAALHAEKDFQAWTIPQAGNVIIYVQSTTSALKDISVENAGNLLSSHKLTFDAAGWKEQAADPGTGMQPGEILKLQYAGTADGGAKMQAQVEGGGNVKKDLRVLPASVQISAESFLSFPERVHFPGRYLKRSGGSKQ